jgi:hypothetical protein
MDVMGPKGLFIYSTLVSLALTVFVVVRIRQMPRPAAKGGFVEVAPSGAAASTIGARSDTQSPARDDVEPQPQLSPSAEAKTETSS